MTEEHQNIHGGCQGDGHVKVSSLYFLICFFLIFFLYCFEFSWWMYTSYLIQKKKRTFLFVKKMHILLLLCLNLNSSPWPTGWSPNTCNRSLFCDLTRSFFQLYFQYLPFSAIWITGNLLNTPWCFNHFILNALSCSLKCFTLTLPAHKCLPIYAANFNLGVDPPKLCSSASPRINFLPMTQQTLTEQLYT